MLGNLIPATLMTGQGWLFLVLGSVLGLIFGILPGLGGPQVIALLIPITFGMDPNLAVTVILGAMAATTYGGSITAILINSPGTPQSAATAIDGFALARQGKAGMAIGAASAASLLGAIFGAIVLTAILPFGRYIVMAVAYPEMFMLALMGLTMIAALSEGTLWKGLIAAGLGLTFTLVGQDPITGVARFTFGSAYLWDGVKLIPALIGLFTVGEMVDLFQEKGTLTQSFNVGGWRGVAAGALSVLHNFGLFIRSSIIGTIIGIIPGVGGAVANYLAYGHAVNTVKKNPHFGKGDIRGVIAPESANNAKDGGSLVPTLLLGVPGSAETAVLIGALIIAGFEPGPKLMFEHPDTVIIMIYTLVLANVLVCSLGALSAGYLARITRIPTQVLAPVILMLSLIGAYLTDLEFWDVVVALAFGLLGYLMKRFDFPRVPLVLALVLGEIAQKNFMQTMALWGLKGFLVRPISLTLLVLTIIMVWASIRQKRRVGDGSPVSE